MFPVKAELMQWAVVMSHRVFAASDKTQLWARVAAFIKRETRQSCFFKTMMHNMTSGTVSDVNSLSCLSPDVSF